jgi:hypothetical protein
MILIVLAAAATVAGWGWIVSHNRPETHQVPHFIMWDIVADALIAKGEPVFPGPSRGVRELDESLILQGSAWLIRNLDESYPAMSAIQIPFLLMLVLSVGLFAWRFGGPVAGAVAALSAALGHATVGNAIRVDDLLAIQALCAAAMALFAWSTSPRFGWLGLFACVPLALAPACTVLFSNGLQVLGIVGIGWFAVLVWRLRRKESTWPWLYLAGLSAVVGWFGAQFDNIPFFMRYIFAEVGGNTHSVPLSQNPLGLLAYPGGWWSVQAGAELAACCLVAVVVLIWAKKIPDALPALLWFLIPLILLSILPKRHDNYLLGAVPAAYALIGLGVASLKRYRWLAGVAVVLLGLFSWVETAATDRGLINAVNPFGGFQDHAIQYLITPVREANEIENAARFAVDGCESKRVLILNFDRDYGKYQAAFLMWAYDSQIIPGDPRHYDPTGPAPCLLVHAPWEVTTEMPLVDLLFQVRDRVDTSEAFEPFPDQFVQRIEADSERFKLYGQENEWVLYRGVP